jgi:NADPH-dependent 2,4-dienoyl-CoA reductase/sulfur reductase-like enzyme
MPLARIDLRKGKPAEYRRRVGQVVYEAMLNVGVPPDDRFQVLTEHDPDGLVYAPGYVSQRWPTAA